MSLKNASSLIYRSGVARSFRAGGQAFHRVGERIAIGVGARRDHQIPGHAHAQVLRADGGRRGYFVERQREIALHAGAAGIQRDHAQVVVVEAPAVALQHGRMAGDAAERVDREAGLCGVDPFGWLANAVDSFRLWI